MTKSGVDLWQWSSLTQILTLFIPNLLGGPLGEEPGWRGFALPRLQRRFDNVGTGIILNDLIGKARLYSNTVQHNVLWLAYGGMAAMICIVTRGRLGYQPKTD